MNVLFVTYDFPFPTNSGGKNRAYHLLKYTAKKANVFLYSYVREDYNPEHNGEILSLGVKKIQVFKRRKLSSFSNFAKTVLSNSSIFKTLYYDEKVFGELVELIKREKIDIVHFESTYTGFFIGKRLKKLGVKLVLGTENIEFMLYYDYAKNLNKFYLKPFVYYQAKRLKKEELDMVRNADAVTTITKQEADILERLTSVKSGIVANGIEPETYSYAVQKELKNNLLFVGNFMYFPNIDAMDFFYKNVFPKLDKKLTLTVIGKKVKEKFNFSDKRIVCKDFVENIIDEYRNADVLVFPIRIGGGTNFKVLEAMALGVPIVAQPDRLSGLNVESEEHFLAATTGEEYVKQIERIYNDSALRKKLSLAARKVIEERYAWEQIGKELLKVWEKSLEL